MTKVPTLRFKEFSEDWNLTNLRQVTNGFEYGMNSAATEFDGENKYIRITDIDESTNKYLNNNVVSPSGDLEEKYLVKQNDILFARTGASTGKTYLYNHKDGKLYFAGFLIRANINCDNNSKFIFLQTKTRAYNNWVQIMSMRSGQPGINSQEYASYSFYAPSKEEQEKIASFFSLIDKKIELQTEKVEELKNYKKGIMQKIFSQELRFKDENGNEYLEWEISTIEKIANLEKGFTPDTKDEESWIGDIPWLSIADMKQGKYVANVSKYISNKALGKKHLVPTGTLIMSFKLTIGRLAIVEEPLMTNEAICHFYWKNSNINTEYMYYYLNSVNVESFGCRAAKGITLNNDSLNSIVVKIPVIQEQKKISELLMSVDKKIEKEQEKLERLKQYKQGLLQQMFI